MGYPGRYPEKVLASGEQVVLHRHPHWKRLFWPVVVLILASAAASFGSAVVNATNWDPSAKRIIFAVIGAIWLVVIGWLTLWPFLNWLTTHFVITDRRVMFRHGVLSRSGIDIPLARINSVEFRHRLIDRILRTGTLRRRVGVTRPVGVLRHSARGAGPRAAVSRGFRHPRV